MYLFESLLSKFLDDFLCKSFSDIKSILIGGSVAKNNYKGGDIDVMIICKDGKGQKTYKILEKEFINQTYKSYFDIKIIEERQISTINSSIDAPFFYGFMKDAICLSGEDLRSKFKIKKIWMYYTIQDILNKLETIKEVYYVYKQYKIAKIILYELAKKLTIIYEICAEKKSKSNNQVYENLSDMLGKYSIIEFKKLAKKQRNWISIYETKSKRGEVGFHLLRIKRKEKESIKEKEFLDGAVERVKNFGKNCISIINI